MINRKIFAVGKFFLKAEQRRGTAAATTRDWLSMLDADECKQDMRV